MNKKILSLSLAMIFFTGNYLLAGQKREITESLAVEVALKNSRELAIASRELAAASGKLFEGFSGFLPKINLGASYTRLSDPQMKLSGPAAALFSSVMSPAMTSDKIFGAQLSVQQPIFMWGKIYYGNKQARLNYKIALEKYRRAKLETAYKAKENFYRALLAKKMLSIAEASSELSKTYYETTRKLYLEGKASSYDVSRAKVGLANANLGLLRAANAERLSREALKTFLVLDDEDIEVVGEFGYLEKNFEIDDVIKKAISTRPELKIAQWQKEMGASAVKFYSADNKPQVVGSYNYTAQAADLNTNLENWDKRWQAALYLQWSIFDGLATYGRIRQAKANFEQIAVAAEAQKDGIEFEARMAYLNFVQAREAIEAQKENVQTARSNLHIAQSRYSLGLVSYLELQDVHLALAQAETNYQQSLHDYNLALAAILKVTATEE